MSTSECLRPAAPLYGGIECVPVGTDDTTFNGCVLIYAGSGMLAFASNYGPGGGLSGAAYMATGPTMFSNDARFPDEADWPGVPV